MASKVKRGLRDDVHDYASLLGQVIADQVGGHVLSRVEGIRQQAKSWRGGDAAAWELLRQQVQGLPDAEVGSMLRAFSGFFQLVNLLEATQRIRRGRAYENDGAAQAESFLDLVRDLKKRGMGRDALLAGLSRISIEPVFTAHPSQARRRVILEKEQRIAAHMLARQRIRMTPRELAISERQIRTELGLCWQTREHPDAAPDVDDERDSVVFALTDVLFPAVVDLFATLADALQGEFGSSIDLSEIPPWIHFGTWVGGDMDGNTAVTASTVAETLEQQRNAIIACYRQVIEQLAGRLTQTRGVVAVDVGLGDKIKRYSGWFPRAAKRINARHENMPYRVLLRLIDARLVATRANTAHAYTGPDGFINDLRLIQCSLRRNRGLHAGAIGVEELIACVGCFGFHLASLDIRVDARPLRRVVGRLIGRSDWDQSSSGERCYHLLRSLSDQTPPIPAEDPEASKLFEVFRTIGKAGKRYPAAAIGRFVISMTHGLDDLLGVLQMARWAGLEDDSGNVRLDIAPLFETARGLHVAPGVMQAALENPVYRKHLEQRGGPQLVMLGYSDSSKESGAFSSRWLAWNSQRALQQVFRNAGVELAFFHGRGGSISRGGGKTSDAIRAGVMAVSGGICRFTEQGEMLHRNFALRGIAKRYLEQICTATLGTQLTDRPADQREKRWREISNSVADESRRMYRAMVMENPHFLNYFRCVTPIDVIERMHIGSRPHRRTGGGGIENLRAIPWVFAWMQCRQLFPAWYGLGSGLQSAVERYGQTTVAEMMQQWHPLRQILTDIELALARVDIHIASAYADLDSSTRGKLMFSDIRDEYQRTVRWLLKLTNAPELLSDRRVIQRATALRNPYLDPLNLLQIRLLREWREAGRPADARQELLMLSVSGIADGMQNTG